MRPGTPHFIVGVEDCMTTGGHFYNRNNLEASMISMIMEHYMGDEITNTEHPTSPIILFKLLFFHLNAAKLNLESKSLSFKYSIPRGNRITGCLCAQVCQMIGNWLP